MAENDSLTAALTGHTNQADIVTTPQHVTITLNGNTTGDSITVTVDGETTDPIAYNASKDDVVSAVEALDNIDEGSVTATGGPLNTAAVVLTVGEQDDIADVPAWSLDDSDLTGTGTLAVTGGDVQAHHTTTVVTDPTSELAVQTPIAQQTGGLNSQSAQSPDDILG